MEIRQIFSFFIVLVLCTAVIKANVLDLSAADTGKAEVRNRYQILEK